MANVGSVKRAGVAEGVVRLADHQEGRRAAMAMRNRWRVDDASACAFRRPEMAADGPASDPGLDSVLLACGDLVPLASGDLASGGSAVSALSACGSSVVSAGGGSVLNGAHA